MTVSCSLAMTAEAGGGLPLLPREERLERGHCFLRAHPFAEQMAFLIDPAGHVLGRQFQELARNRHRFRRIDQEGHLFGERMRSTEAISAFQKFFDRKKG